MCSASSRREQYYFCSLPGVMTVAVNKGYFVLHGLNQHRMFSVLSKKEKKKKNRKNVSNQSECFGQHILNCSIMLYKCDGFDFFLCSFLNI